MTRRHFLLGLLGWVIPGAVALPFAWMNEDAGGEAALLAVVVWWGLGVIGCLVAGVAVGAGVGGVGTRADDFLSGLAGVATAWVAAMVVSAVIEIVVQVLHIGAVAFLLPIPFVIGYGVGFVLGAVANRPGGLTGPGVRVAGAAGSAGVAASAAEPAPPSGSGNDGVGADEASPDVSEWFGKDRH